MLPLICCVFFKKKTLTNALRRVGDCAWLVSAVKTFRTNSSRAGSGRGNYKLSTGENSPYVQTVSSGLKVSTENFFILWPSNMIGLSASVNCIPCVSAGGDQQQGVAIPIMPNL